MNQGKPHLIPDQIAALARFASNEGRQWKSRLMECWRTSNYPIHAVQAGDTACLQQMRNRFGMAWLANFKLPLEQAQQSGISQQAKFDCLTEPTEQKQRDPLYGYYINLDERGDFYADVRDADGSTVFEIRAGSSLGEDESSIFEDGFMCDKHDLSGLTEYLRGSGLIPQDAEVLSIHDFEQRLEASEDDDTNNHEYHKSKRMRM